MKQLSIILMSTILFCSSMASGGPIRLVVNPAHHVLRIGEPAVFTLELSNSSDMPVEGVFVPLKSGFAGLTIEITDPLGNRRLFAFDEIVDDIIYNEVILEPGEVLKSSITILYDMVKNQHVFNNAGDYSISFILQREWKKPQRSVITTSVGVEVLSWSKESPQSINAAMELWMDKDIAYAVQIGTNLSESSLGRLRKLAKEYPETVYGKLASDLLVRAKGP